MMNAMQRLINDLELKAIISKQIISILYLEIEIILKSKYDDLI